jgi:hypothetical protein
MSYLPSGTNYPTQQSNVFPGILNNGNDFVATFYNKAGDLTVSGVSANIVTSRQNVNYSGASNIVLVIGAQEQELQNPTVGNAIGFTPQEFTVIDMFGGAGGANIIVSGAATASGTNSLVRINGSLTSTAVNSAYGTAKYVNISGNVWQKL